MAAFRAPRARAPVFVSMSLSTPIFHSKSGHLGLLKLGFQKKKCIKIGTGLEIGKVQSSTFPKIGYPIFPPEVDKKQMKMYDDDSENETRENIENVKKRYN